jgi:hypothetical protein
MPRKLSAAIAAILMSLATGCGSEVDRQDISGQVTFAGKPIGYGQIMFMPETKAKLAPTGEAEIVDGRFDTSLPGGRGIIPGPHQVRVTAYAQRPPEPSDDETLPTLSDPPIFVGYVLKADVKAGENSFDVPEDAKGFGLGTGQPTRRANDP